MGTVLNIVMNFHSKVYSEEDDIMHTGTLSPPTPARLNLLEFLLKFYFNVFKIETVPHIEVVAPPSLFSKVPPFD